MKGTLAAIATIVTAKGKEVGKWPRTDVNVPYIQPSEVLAYMSATATWLMTIALADGVTKYFWRQAIRGNMPLTNLHYHWKAGTGVWGALQAIRGDMCLADLYHHWKAGACVQGALKALRRLRDAHISIGMFKFSLWSFLIEIH